MAAALSPVPLPVADSCVNSSWVGTPSSPAWTNRSPDLLDVGSGPSATAGVVPTAGRIGPGVMRNGGLPSARLRVPGVSVVVVLLAMKVGLPSFVSRLRDVWVLAVFATP